MAQPRLLSGIQPTGKMHLGNYFGAVHNWVKLQQEYEAYYFVADMHALTSAYEDGVNIRESTLEVVADLIASGIDPEKATLFVQSDIPEHSELHLIFSMITPLPWLERVPTYKSKKEEIQGKDLNTYGFLGYPVLQAADIMLYRADIVPVGKDQSYHIELTREIVRRFNALFKTDYFKEPAEKFTNFPLLPGTDGRKMSKSYGNALFMSESDTEIEQKLRTMFTDPARLRRQDKGNPDICPVFALQGIFNPDLLAELSEGCKSAGIGCVDCKKRLIPKVKSFIGPIRDKREVLLQNKTGIEDILEAGASKARLVAKETLDAVKSIIKIK